MFSYEDQLPSRTKTQLETQLSLFTALSRRVFESMKRLAGLHVATAKATLGGNRSQEASAIAKRGYEAAASITRHRSSR
jgi:hypothetical protein